jgi:hypothetical protein
MQQVALVVRLAHLEMQLLEHQIQVMVQLVLVQQVDLKALVQMAVLE